MGFFKKLGKGIKKGVGGIVKMASIKNIKKLAAGDYQSVVLEAQNRAINGIKTGVLGEFTKKTVGTGSKVSPAQAVLIKRANALEANNMSAKNPGFVEILGGAMQGAGNVLANGNTVQEAGANAVDGVAMTWLKRNWLKLAGVLLLATVVVFGMVKVLGGRKSSRSKYRP